MPGFQFLHKTYRPRPSCEDDREKETLYLKCALFCTSNKEDAENYGFRGSEEDLGMQPPTLAGAMNWFRFNNQDHPGLGNLERAFLRQRYRTWTQTRNKIDVEKHQKIKVWTFELFSSNEPNLKEWPGLPSEFKVHLVVPHNVDSTKGKRKSAVHEDEANFESQFPDCQEAMEQIVEHLVQKAKPEDRLTVPEKEEEFRKWAYAELEKKVMSIHNEVRSKKRKWADYVFDPGYQRFALEEVRKFVLENRHLPMMRSEAEVERTGINLEHDFVDLLSAVENIYLYLFESHARGQICEKQGLRDCSLHSHPFADWHRQFLEVVFTYARNDNYWFTKYRTMVKSSDAAARDRFVTEHKLMKQLQEPNQGCLKVYRYFLETLGHQEVFKLAEMAQEMVDNGEAVKETAAGQFIYLCKHKEDPKNRYLLSRSEEESKKQYNKWKPRLYQLEMAAAASEDSTLLVAPTGCGKTKVAAMLLNDLWNRNQDGKAVFLVNQVALAIQQKGHLLEDCRRIHMPSGQKSRPRIKEYTGISPILQRMTWQEL
mmetsp:Transcript_2493/g.4006  ORF Transcript_2493/g.4006 Transcript_2493/m.4006 type:complete len:540 (-) Transcript_2493:2101-3720(-)